MVLDIYTLFIILSYVVMIEITVTIHEKGFVYHSSVPFYNYT